MFASTFAPPRRLSTAALCGERRSGRAQEEKERRVGRKDEESRRIEEEGRRRGGDFSWSQDAKTS